MKDTFTIKQDLKFRELYGSTMYYLMTGKYIKIYGILLISLMLLSSILGFLTADKYKLTWLSVFQAVAPLLIILLVICILTLVLTLLSYKLQSKLFKNVSYRFTHWGVVRTDQRGEFSIPWRSIIRVKESRSYFAFYIAKNNYHIVQKRMFSGSDEIELFRIFVAECMKSSR